MTVIVAGAAGFIGSNFVLNWVKNTNVPIIGLDSLTYAGNIKNLESLIDNKKFKFVKGDINNFGFIKKLFDDNFPSFIINFAAESHVDRSILDSSNFIKTNINGTYNLLECSRQYWDKLDKNKKNKFRYLHVSTDEVYGSLKLDEPEFTELSIYKPNSPYSASKAASDHLVRAWHHTYNLPVLTSNCSNNYGPYQFPEKLIPLIIYNAINNKDLPIYGDGLNIRDWLYVDDHCSAIRLILDKGKPGETYNVGGNNEKTNLEVVNHLCKILDDIMPKKNGESYFMQIKFIKDRKGHDYRYAINSSKLRSELGWRPKEDFETGIYKTVKWYIENQEWVNNVISGEYKEWVKENYK